MIAKQVHIELPHRLSVIMKLNWAGNADACVIEQHIKGAASDCFGFRHSVDDLVFMGYVYLDN